MVQRKREAIPAEAVAGTILDEYARTFEDLAFPRRAAVDDAQRRRETPKLARGQVLAGRTPAAAAVNFFLPKLKWTSDELAAASDVTPTQLSEWISGRLLTIGADEISRIAWALSARLDDVSSLSPPTDGTSSLRRRARVGRSALDYLLHTLLALAGHSSPSVLENVVWRRRFESLEPAEEPIQVGWFPWRPLVTGETFPGSLAYDITNYVCTLLGFADIWKPRYVRFLDVPSDLQSRALDLMAPMFMILPARYSTIGFSKALPGLSTSLCAVVPRKAWTHSAWKALPKTRLPARDFELVLPPNEVGSIVAPIAFEADLPRDQIVDDPEIRDLHPSGHSYSLVEAIKEQPFSASGLPRVLITSLPTGRWAQSRYNDALSVVVPQELAHFRFGFGFAAHRHEPRLIAAINDAIDVLESAGTLRALYSRHRGDLKGGGITVEEEPPPKRPEIHAEQKPERQDSTVSRRARESKRS